MVALLKQHNIIDFPDQRQGNNEWYTPAKYIDAAREVMGGNIDLDPASCEMANQTVRATRYYTKEDDGLQQAWTIDGRPSRIWLNPPYAKDPNATKDKQSNILKWTTKLLSDYKSGEVEQAILLTMAKIETAWFQPLWEYPICFANHIVRFYLPLGCTRKSRLGWKTDAHQFGTAFVYLGPHENRFTDIFSQFGTIAKRVSLPCERPEPMRTLWDGGDA